MYTEERKNWLKWSKIGICVPQQNNKGIHYGGECRNAIKAARRDRTKI